MHSVELPRRGKYWGMVRQDGARNGRRKWNYRLLQLRLHAIQPVCPQHLVSRWPVQLESFGKPSYKAAMDASYRRFYNRCMEPETCCQVLGQVI